MTFWGMCFINVGNKDQGTHKNVSVTHKWVTTQCLGNSGLKGDIHAS